MRDDDDGEVRFCIEADYRDEPEVAKVIKYPQSHNEALTLFDHYSAQYPCVWLCEYGEYRVGSQIKQEWIYYRWTPKTNWGDIPGRFTGYPESNLYEPQDYVAINRDGSRIP